MENGNILVLRWNETILLDIAKKARLQSQTGGDDLDKPISSEQLIVKMELIG